MKMTYNDSIINHCPHCDSLCLLSQSEVDTAQAANKAIAITCHQCNAQFGLDHNCPAGTKSARPAEMQIVDCPSCKMAITIPTHPSSNGKIDLFCPLCDSEIQQANPDNQAATTPAAPPETPSPVTAISKDNVSRPDRDTSVNRMPLYLLILVCLAVYLYWARETGQLPIDQWLKILG
jgi:uncharacterized Zn finger protein (UPF0148 family)